MAKLKLIYFIEDIAHEGFMRSMVERIAKEETISANFLHHEFRYATRGSLTRKKISTEGFRKLLKDMQKLEYSDFAFLIVVFDGNCKGHNERKMQLASIIKANHPFRDRTVFAVPDPHVERWYIMDQRAFSTGTGVSTVPPLPPYKCQKDYYKIMVHNALRAGGINSQLGGAEYAERIVANMYDLYALGKSEPAFGDFVTELRRRLKQFKSQ